MADTDPADPSTPNPTPTPVPPPARRKRRWLRVALGVVVVAVVALLLLVGLAPTLLGTRPAMDLVLAQVNKRLNGHVAVASASFGWTSGVRLEGVQVFDDAQMQIAQADHVTCPMPLWRAATGKYPLGDTVVDGLSFDAKYDGQGRLNFAQLAKSSPAEPAPAQGKPAAPGRPSKLPDVSGDVQVRNARGTVSQPGKPTVYLTALAAEVKMPGTNDPITDHVDASVRVGDAGPVVRLVADGTAAAIKGNVVDLDSANVHQTADVTNLDLAAAKPFVPAAMGLDTLSGLLAAHLVADVTDGKSAAVDAAVTGGQKVRVGGRLLKGDVFSSDTFAAAVPKLTATFPDGLGHWQSGRVTVGVDAGSQPVLFKVDQGQATLVLDVVPQAVLNLADGHAPGSAGRVEFADHVDVGKLAGQLKNTASLSPGATLTRGTLDQSVKLALTPDRGTVAVTTDLADVAGTQDGKPVTVQPVHLAVAAADVGGRPLDALRDLSLKLSSKFANADFHGATVGDLTGTLTAQLQTLQAEVGQLVDFKGTKLAGDVSVRVADSGQLMQAPYQAQVKVDATVKDLQYADASGPRVAEPLVAVDVTGDLHGSDKAAVESIKNLLLTLKAGAADAPTVDVAAAVPTATLGADPSADFRLTRLMVNVQQVQQQFENVPAGQAGIVCGGGTLTGTAAGHYGKAGVRLDPSTFTLAHLTVQKQLATGQRVAAIADDTFNLSAAGTVGLGDAKTVALTALSVADTAKIIDVHKGDGDLMLTQTKDTAAGHGQLAVTAELGSINGILRALTQETAAVATPAGRVKSGRLTGTLSFDAAAGGKTDVNGHFDVPDLDVATATSDTGPQAATILIRGSSDDATHTIRLDEASFKAPFATAAVTNGTVLLSAKSTVDELQRASLAVDVPDLKTLMALAQSFSAPPPPAKPGEVPAPPPPLVYTAGSVSMRADVAHDGDHLTVTVPTLTATNVAFTRGPATYAAKPITAKLAAVVGTADGKTVLQQLRGLKVTQLDATTGVATVTMTTPITVADLSNPAASAAGGVRVDGELADLSALLAAVTAKPADAYPYRGHYTLTEDLTGGNGVGVKGGLGVAKLQVMQGQAVQFAEDQLNVTDDVSLAADLNSVYVHALTVAMQSSGALNVSVTGGTVIDLAHARALHLPVQLQYDLAKLWPIVHPMLLTPGKPDGYADLKITGAFTKQVLIGGSYPADLPSTEAIKPLTVDADLAVATLDYSGIVIKDLDVPVTLRNGKATTAKPDGTTAPAATANDGQLDLSNLTVDLTQAPPRLSTPANKVVLAKVSINPLFTKGILASVVNNPIFVGAQQATGLIDLSLDSCDRLPLGELVKQNVAANDGSAHVKFSMKDVHIGVPGLTDYVDFLKNQSFETHVTDATVVVAHGSETQHIAFVSGPYALGFNGTVRLADDAMVPLTLTLPISAALGKQGALDPNLKKYLPDTVPVTFTGTTTHWGLDVNATAGPLLQDATKKAVQGGLGDFLGKQLGGNKAAGAGGGGAAATSQPANPADALGGFLNGLGKKKHK